MDVTYVNSNVKLRKAGEKWAEIKSTKIVYIMYH